MPEPETVRAAAADDPEQGDAPTWVQPAEHTPPAPPPERSHANAATFGFARDYPDPAPRDPRRTRRIIATVAAVVLLLAGGTAGGLALMTRKARPSAVPTPTAGKPATKQVAPVPATVTVTASPSPAASPSPTEQSFPDLYKSVSSGVVRIETTACDGGGVGSGFLIAPDMVATVAHVVAGAASVVVRDGSTTTTGTVIGYDAHAELALVRTSRPLAGHVFNLDPSQPEVGDDIGAIGYPLGGQESLSKGAVSGLGRGINVEGHQLRDLIQTDASINPGNSGGPLLTEDGTVVGLVEAKRSDAENIGYAIPASDAVSRFDSWRATPTQVRWPTGCDAPTGPDGAPIDITDRSGDPDGPAIVQAFSTYVAGINTGDYATAYNVLSPHDQQRVSYEQFSSGTASSYIVDLSVDSVASHASGDTVEVRFTSVQDPAYGVHHQTCSNWAITYTMVPSGDTWLIDNSAPHPGSPNAC